MKVKKEKVIKFKQNIINQIEEFVEEICDFYNISNSYYANIIIALTEVINTPDIFSKENTENSYIKIFFSKKSKSLSFTINCGNIIFDKNIILINGEKNDLNTEKGKRKFLINSLVDTVNFNKSKNEIELVFFTSGIEKEKTQERKKSLSNYYNSKKQKVK
ncbi:MAG: hypothetical protein KAV44_04275 [Bacteroidales bacterium]|nr:hypothetical protein [Bacteroidales bacterium]